MDDFNDQYCRLAREGRLDGSDSLKLKFIGINGDWDELSDEVPIYSNPLLDECSKKLYRLISENSFVLFLKTVQFF